MNGSHDDQAHFLQVWVMPAKTDVEPRYAQRSFDPADRANQWQLVVSPDGRDGSLPIHQDASLRIAELAAGSSLELSLGPDRHGYLHVATGRVQIDGQTLAAGDAATWQGDSALTITASDDSQLLAFDLA
jgi:redox-sensitive bicupin YhaK (pirin superfamily)